WTEAQIDPTANEPSKYGVKTAKEATSGRMGIGYGQWTFERHTALVKWSKDKHDTEEWWKTDIQLDYMVKGDDMYVDILKNLAL
ncbi:phage tail tip lysozyme, partial [Staphylococcus aureus]|nr:phage tail tip lysozyme [Staphylococcus aureus]